MSNKKKLLLLGGLRYLIPVIKKAQDLGLHVITCDNIPHNIAHKYADEYKNLSIIDKDTVLAFAKSKNISGIMSFAVDPGVLTAAYVAEKLNLPYAGSYNSVKILQNKNLFRQFLRENNFKVPHYISVSSFKEALAFINTFKYPIIVKPTDSAGSKGVTKVEHLNELETAVEKALSYSFSKKIIIEDFINQKGFSSDSDCFSLNGELVFTSFSDQIFIKSAPNPYTPAGFIWPQTMDTKAVKVLTLELQRLIKLLNLKSSIYNVETRLAENGIPYIMEVSPRGGGNRICELLKMSTGVDLIENAIKVATGEEAFFPKTYSYNGFWSQLVLYTDKNGKFEKINIDDSLKKHIVEQDIWVKKGDTVIPFTGANATIGTLIFKFKSREEADDVWRNIREKIHIEVVK